MRDILKQRKDKLTRAYKANPQLATYARLREVTLLLNKLYQHDKATSTEGTSHAERGDTPAPVNSAASLSGSRGWRKRQINNLKEGEINT
jgi:hypothetical protein